MKRRDALKNIGLAAGFAIATPTILSILQGCTSESKSWIPSYLTEDEKSVVTNIVDVFLPKTKDTPSANEVNVPQFIDRYIFEILNDKNQQLTRIAFNKIITQLKVDNPSSSINELNPDNYKSLLENYMLLENEIDQERVANPDSEEMTLSEFLNQLKWMTINAYKNSEEVGENILAYDPIPTTYYCGDLQELTGGKSWSL